jgi:beta-xylosidase
MKHLIAIFFLALPLAATAQVKSQTWCPDNGDGTYTNPVLNADYSDPDLCAVGDDYYLTASSFNCMPGLPILHSKDLVNWEIIGHALQHQFPDSLMPQHGKGVWAPAIRYHNKKYYIYWGDPDRGVMRVWANDPAGPWSRVQCVVPGKGMIDPCPLWDDDGRCYLINGWANSRSGFNSVLTLRELDEWGGHAIGDPVIVFDGGNENHTTEGPKLYKRDGWYWIMCPAGGVEGGWQLAMRSKNIYGPYEARRVLQQGHTKINGPHQGGWVHTPQGEDWFMHFQDRGAYGRVVWLQPVDWSSGWPIMGKKGEPMVTAHKPKSTSHQIFNPVESDEFNEPRLGLQWQWQADYDQSYGMPTCNGTFRLYSFRLPRLTADGRSLPANLWNVPNMLLQKLPAQNFVVTTKFRMASKNNHQQGGLIMMGRDYGALVVERSGERFLLKQLVAHDADEGGAETATVLASFKPSYIEPLEYHRAYCLDIYMRMTVHEGQATFAYSLDGKHYKDVGLPFTLRVGKWIGAKMGLVCTDNNAAGDLGFVDADWFRVGK